MHQMGVCALEFVFLIKLTKQFAMEGYQLTFYSLLIRLHLYMKYCTIKLHVMSNSMYKVSYILH